MSNTTSSYSLNSSTLVSYLAGSPTSTHPCPNAGYSCSECPDGWFCPPQQTPAQNCICGYGWACANCKDGYFCIPSPTSGGSGLLNPVASLLVTSPTTPSSLSTLHPLGSAVSMDTGTIMCVDGSVVMMAKDCLDGVFGATGTGTVNVLDITIINKAMTALSATPTSISGLAGGLLRTANADISVLGNAQPTAGAGLTNAAGNILPTATAALNNVPGNLLSSDAKDVTKATTNVVSQLSTIVNGQSTVLPIVETVLNRNPTMVPIVKTMINGISMNLPVVNSPTGKLAQASGMLKRRRWGLNWGQESSSGALNCGSECK